jgi:putative nucleotidyltransferase with HDIG domain
LFKGLIPGTGSGRSARLSHLAALPIIENVALRRGITLGVNITALLAVALLGVRSSTAADWQPAVLVALLFGLSVISDSLAVPMRAIRVSGDFPAIVLAMALLGPLPAAVIGMATAAVDAVVSRPSWEGAVANLATYGTFPLVGGFLMRLAEHGHAPAGVQPLHFAASVLIVALIVNQLNFAMITFFGAVRFRISVMEHLRRVHLTFLPSQFAAALLTAGIAYVYCSHGVGAVALAAVAILLFQYLLRAGVLAVRRGEELGERTRELASLQVGLLTAVLQTLSMRDAMTARHSAAVARYSREVAKMLGLDEREQELIHTAALLHDIGKFIFPDSILFADRKLTEEEWQTVKLHPEQGAQLVRRIEGYGPVAEIVNHHHERYEGGGYPTGIAGDAIPIGSRIIAAADTYDVMTSRDSYRRPVSSEAALAELRRVAGTQLDPVVVETFERMILERRVAFSHVDEADFERELAFDRRVRDYARPRSIAA